jgi:hypothetical protein
MTDISRRHSGRITKSTPIVLLGCDAEGRVFSEETRTVILSFHGAGIVSSHKLIAEQEMTLRSLVTLREAEIRVVGEIAKQDDFYVYGVSFLDDSLNFWQEHFPPPPDNGGRPLLLALECNSCHTPVTLKNGEFESDICTIHGGLVRYCDDCGYSTVWKPSVDTPHPVVPQPAFAKKEQFRPTFVALLEPEFIPNRASASVPQLPDRPSDQRLHVRAKINYFACIRSEVFGDEIVPCVDMSRGGLSFRSKFAHPITSELRIAVPISPDAPVANALFVFARVVNIAEIPGLDRYRCGVAFLPRS